MEGVESNACYILMEDDSGLTGRCMTLPQRSNSHPINDRLPPPPPRTATFSAPLNYTRIAAAVESPARAVAVTETTTEEDKKETVSTENAPLQRRVKTGILRQSTVLDDGEAKHPRIKKHVSITLPESTQTKLASRRRFKRAATVDGIPEGAGEEEDSAERGQNGEVIVQVDVNSTEEEDEGAHVSAVELLNQGGRTDEEEEERDEPDIIILRDSAPRRQPSLRESLTNSLSRISNRMRRGKPPKLRRLQSALDFDRLAKNELELKANLYWHIATPIKRWKVEGQVPIKLVLQLLKTLCLIVQVILFTNTIAHKRGEFFFDSRIVFESLFVVDFNVETALQERILYNRNEVTNEIDFIATNYYRLPDVTIGGYDHVRDENDDPVPIQFRLRQYRVAVLNASDSRFTLDGHVDEINFNVSGFQNATEALFNNSQDPLFHKFVDLEVSIPVNVIRIEAPQKAECYRFDVKIQFVNDDHNGKFLYNLKTNYRRINKCRGEILYDNHSYDVIKGTLIVLNLIVLKFCLLSLFLTFKTLRRAYRLGKAMGRFYHECLNLPLTWRERRSLFSTWHYINILSDLLIASGTIYKILLEFEVVLDASAARILLGTALLFQAAVILRYVNYFKQVNALTRTLALAFPELMKFLLCGAVLFFAFALCGWIVLGPFHPKFTDFNDTVETLFSLLNGDDIYNTYILLDPQVDYAAYIYSRIFLYVFLGLFIYSVLNLFTSLVISAHEVSQNKDTAVENEVRRFVFSGPLTPRGVALRDVTSTSKYVDPTLILNKVERKRKNSSDDDDS